MGNPSDGFGGKTISCMISNFGARVRLYESSTIEIMRHPIFDPLTFRCLDELATIATHDGYYGGIRLLYATCKKFHEFFQNLGVRLPDRNFALQYETDIPRRMGLAGSSAIIAAAVKALMAFYDIGEDERMRPLIPNLILSVETEELGIQAGLQDRVVQTYGGLVYMDFSPQHFADQGHGVYEQLPLDLLPPLYLAYADAPSDSGKIHSPVRYRFDQGEPEVVDTMKQLAALADQCKEVLLARDYETLGALMDHNFDLRRKIYGDACLGKRNLEMIELARSLGLSAKFPGSGGAIIGICDAKDKFDRAETAFRERGFQFLQVSPADNTGG